MKYLLKKYRIVMGFFIAALIISGITAVPVQLQLEFLLKIIPAETAIYSWLHRVLQAYLEVASRHPFLLYGYDWLAFAHVILAIMFIGPFNDPVRNVWVVKAGLIACVLVLPLAFIAGYFRGIPWGWQLIDCSFGVFGAIPLYYCYRLTGKIEKQQINTNHGNSYSKRMVEKQVAH